MRPDLLLRQRKRERDYERAGVRRRCRTRSMQRILDQNQRKDLPEFRPGDTIRVHVKIKEGEKERLQAFEGVVIARKNSRHGRDHHRPEDQLRPGRRAHLPGERPGHRSHRLHSHGRVRRAKLYYLRGLRGKAARLREREQPRRLRLPPPRCEYNYAGN